MKKAITTVHTIIVILGLLATAGWSAYYLYSQRQFNSENSIKRLPALVERVSSSLERSDTLYDRSFGEEIKQIFAENKDIIALSVYSYDTGVDYFYSRNAQVKVAGENPDSVTGSPEYKGISFSNAIGTVPLQIANKPGSNIDVVFTVLPRTSIFYVLKISLLAVIVLFIITLILIIAFSLSRDSSPKASESDEEEFDSEAGFSVSEPDDSGFDSSFDSDDFSSADDMTIDSELSLDNDSFSMDEEPLDSSDDFDLDLPSDDEFSTDDLDLDLPSGNEPEDTEFKLDDSFDDDLGDLDLPDDDGSDDFSLDEELADIPAEEDLLSMEHEETSSDLSELDMDSDMDLSEDDFDLPEGEDDLMAEEPESLNSDSSEPTLYNPETGLGWEAFLEERLGLELERSASFDQDLVLVMIREIGDSSDMENISSIVREEYSYHDLIFEAGSNTLALIEPNKDLDEAIGDAQSLVKKISSETSSANIKCGLSSRNGRLITGKRLINEADTSLNKADEENPIVGFRSDPERFREYLGKSN
ncbi:MAG: hypothetical protein PQJ50_09510 [Spirochaetales bacterium]|nr:hypothetical protein [Spirochaetales bacterium]